MQKKKIEYNEQRLENAIQKYKDRPKVPIDPARVYQKTESQIHKKTSTYDVGDKVSLYNVHGYNIDTLMKDVRFKLNTALFEAGLQNTTFGNQLMVSLSKKPEI